MTATMRAATERRCGPLPLPAEAEHYRCSIRIPGQVRRCPSPYPTPLAALRYAVAEALHQADYSETKAPGQVDHWLWVAEGLQRDVDAASNPVPHADAETVQPAATPASRPFTVLGRAYQLERSLTKAELALHCRASGQFAPLDGWTKQELAVEVARAEARQAGAA